jgi:hypothetical protein
MTCGQKDYANDICGETYTCDACRSARLTERQGQKIKRLMEVDMKIVIVSVLYVTAHLIVWGLK